MSCPTPGDIGIMSALFTTFKMSAVISKSNTKVIVMSRLSNMYADPKCPNKSFSMAFGLSAYVLTSRKDFSFMGGMLRAGMIVVILAMVGLMFFPVPAASLAMSAVVVLLMSGFILYDTSNIVQGHQTNYILATVGLYLNIYNLFIHLLHLISAFSGDD